MNPAEEAEPMNLQCIRCNATFDADRYRGYCDDCIAHFQEVRKGVHRKQRPAPGVWADGKFTAEPCPVSVFDPVSECNVCGLCGSDRIESGYGLGGGYGMGSYNFCFDCNNFLDFCEDME